MNSSRTRTLSARGMYGQLLELSLSERLVWVHWALSGAAGDQTMPPVELEWDGGGRGGGSRLLCGKTRISGKLVDP